MPTGVRSQQARIEIPQRCGISVKIGGTRARLYGLRDIAEFWPEVTYRQVQRWYMAGLLPEPYILKVFNLGAVPYWCRRQAVVIYRAIDAHWDKGFTKLSARHKLTLQRLATEGEAARLAFIKSLSRSVGPVRRVEWLDK